MCGASTFCRAWRRVEKKVKCLPYSFHFLQRIVTAPKQHEVNKVQKNPLPQQPETLLRLPAVVARVGLQKSAIYEMLNREPPAFPRPLKLSRRAVCWPASKIDQWIAERIAASGDKS